MKVYTYTRIHDNDRYRDFILIQINWFRAWNRGLDRPTVSEKMVNPSKIFRGGSISLPDHFPATCPTITPPSLSLSLLPHPLRNPLEPITYQRSLVRHCQLSISLCITNALFSCKAQNEWQNYNLIEQKVSKEWWAPPVSPLSLTFSELVHLTRGACVDRGSYLLMTWLCTTPECLRSKDKVLQPPEPTIRFADIREISLTSRMGSVNIANHIIRENNCI